MKGCDEPAPIPVFALDGENYFRCPYSLITPLTAELLRFYIHYKQGNYPVAGGLLDQSTLFLRGVEIIDQEIQENGSERNSDGGPGR